MNEYEKVLNFAKELLAIPSPSGYTMNAIEFIKKECIKRNLNYEILKTGNIVISMEGKENYIVGFTSHIDTLGAIVRSIKSDGTLNFDCIGGPILPTYDGEYCIVHTRDGKEYNGTFLSNAPAAHVHKGSSTLERNKTTMHIRLDEVVYNKQDVLKLGISNGDFITCDPKTVITKSGFIKSRYLDDKLSVAILFGLIDYLKENNITPKYNLKFICSVYEEVGFGSSYVPEVDELIAVDMGCVGEDLDGNEEKVCICAKDSAGPYNYEITTKLINLAKENKLNYAVDIFPMYSSDVSAALRAGNNLKGGLIGSGVAASHGMERSHINGVKNTLELLKAYVR